MYILLLCTYIHTMCIYIYMWNIFINNNSIILRQVLVQNSIFSAQDRDGPSKRGHARSDLSPGMFHVGQDQPPY